MRKRKALFVRVLILAIFLNSASFASARLWFTIDDFTLARAERVTIEEQSDSMTYLIAGNLNQPLAAFDFLTPELEGNLTYVQFQMLGWDAQAVAEDIAREVQTAGLKSVKVYTISQGDHVGRYLEEYLDGVTDLQIVAINPCSDVSFLCSPLGGLLQGGAWAFRGVCYGLGWLSLIPIVPSCDGGGYSLMLLSDQYWSLAYDHPEPLTSHTLGVVCSQPGEEDNDGLLENAVIREYFQEHAKIVTIVTEHGQTIDRPEEYLNGVRQILYGE